MNNPAPRLASMEGVLEDGSFMGALGTIDNRKATELYTHHIVSPGRTAIRAALIVWLMASQKSRLSSTESAEQQET